MQLCSDGLVMYVIVRRFQFTVVSTVAFVSFLERHFFSSDGAFAKLEDGKILDLICVQWALEIQARPRISVHALGGKLLPHDTTR
jgi:hypothetical protein